MLYGNIEIVQKEINRLEQVDDKELLDELLKLNSKILENKHLKENCNSDFSYWGYVSREEEYDSVKDYLEDRILNLLGKLNLSKLNILVKHNERLETILNNKKEIINGLNMYKPSQYKAKIELIEKIFEEKN